jgi:HlyD family secretion protein
MHDTLARLAILYQLVRAYARAHKVVSAIVILVLLGGGYYTYTKITAPSTAPRYILATVATGTVVATLTESGQVSASHQLMLAPKASGEVIGVYAKPGDYVGAGRIIAQLDARDAAQALRDAELSLETALLTYQQDTATSTLALNLLTAQNGATNADIALAKAHDAAYASIASVYSDLGTIMNGLDTALHGSNVAGREYQKNIDAYGDAVITHDASISLYQSSAATSYTSAVTAYQSALIAYKVTSRSISNDDLVALAQSTYLATQAVADAVKNTHDLFDRVNNDSTFYNLGTPSGLAGLLSSTGTYTTIVTNDLSAALSTKTTIISAEQVLAQTKNTLEATQAGSNTVAVQSAELTLKRAQEAVTTAQQNLADYTVVAPFAGTIASVNVQRYDQAGAGTSVATLVTDQQEAAISVNEVDAAKFKVGQKATLAFDALPGVSIAGTVTSVNAIGAVSQGVVTYGATITFDTKNPLVKPGMSVDASIVTGSKNGVLIVPSSAVKSNANGSYVQVFSPPVDTGGVTQSQGIQTTETPEAVQVTTGLTSDTDTEIVSGLTAGMQVIVRTVTGTTPVTTTTAGGGARAGSIGGIRLP